MPKGFKPDYFLLSLLESIAHFCFQLFPLVGRELHVAVPIESRYGWLAVLEPNRTVVSKTMMCDVQRSGIENTDKVGVGDSCVSPFAVRDLWQFVLWIAYDLVSERKHLKVFSRWMWNDL